MTVPTDLHPHPAFRPAPTIPQCDFLVRKGQIPDLKTFSNVWHWTPELAKRTTEFEPVTEKNVVDGPDDASMRKVQVMEAMLKLEPGDFHITGLPKLSVLREKLAMPDLTQKELHNIWMENKKP